MKRNWILVTVAVVLAVIYVVFFTDWFKPKTLQIFHTSRTVHTRRNHGTTERVMIFGLNRLLPLKEIKVVQLAAYQTNQNTLPLWHLISDSNSVPVKAFVYGLPIRGLKPEVPGVHPQPLAKDTTYRLFVVSGDVKGEHDFELK